MSVHPSVRPSVVTSRSSIYNAAVGIVCFILIRFLGFFSVPSGVVQKEDRYFYKYFSDGKTWQEAQNHCQKLGGNLPIIWNQRTQNTVHKFMTRGWIGARDKTAGRKTGQWKTPPTPWVRNWAMENSSHASGKELGNGKLPPRLG